MATIWDESWTEIWSAGQGRSRSYCGIAATDDGFAVDVFHGDTCVDSTLHEAWERALEHARHMRARYQRVPAPMTPESDRPAAR